MGGEKCGHKLKVIGCKPLFMGSTETAPPKPQTTRSLSCHVAVSHCLLHTPGAAGTWRQRGQRLSHIDARGVVSCPRTRLIGGVD